MENNKDLQVLSFSSIQNWKRCRQLWYYKRVLKLERKRKSIHLLKGNFIHECLENHLLGNDWREVVKNFNNTNGKLMKEEIDYYGDMSSEVTKLVENYIEYWSSKPKVKTLAVELSFGNVKDGEKPFQLDNGVYLTGKIDWIFKDKVGTWVTDHKSTGAEIPSDGYRLFDLQTAIYIKACEQMGYKDIKGVCFNYLKTKLPTVPPILVNGGISRNKKYATDYNTLLKVIKDNKLDKRDYLDMLDEASRNIFFVRKFMPKTGKMLDNMMNELAIVNEEMKYLKDFPIRSMDRTCDFCDFYPLCTAELMDLDTSYIMKADFVRREEQNIEDKSKPKEKSKIITIDFRGQD